MSDYTYCKLWVSLDWKNFAHDVLIREQKKTEYFSEAYLSPAEPLAHP